MEPRPTPDGAIFRIFPKSDSRICPGFVTSLVRTTTTGFHLVTPFRQRWQAKVSARGKQRSLGVFDSPENAALEVLLFHIGKREVPASPTKPRNKRGEGRGGPTPGMA